MALYAFDGTGNEDQVDDAFDSNVCDFFHAYDDPLRNDDPSMERGSLYQKGIGQLARTRIGDWVAGAFGFGGHKRVRKRWIDSRTISKLATGMWTSIGFSRGAALAVSFANELAGKCPRVIIRFMGLWDMVGTVRRARPAIQRRPRSGHAAERHALLSRDGARRKATGVPVDAAV